MMNNLDITTLAWDKMSNLIPAVIQDAENGQVLMLGYMNQEALSLTLNRGQLILYSRSRQELWQKGLSSGNHMTVVNLSTDCDGDSVLVQVLPNGPACHLGFSTCFQPAGSTKLHFLAELSKIIRRKNQALTMESYTSQLLQSGVPRCAQKVGEEATEVVIAAVKGDKEELIEESSDLLFHLLVLLEACQLDIYSILECMEKRHLSLSS